MIIKKTKNNLIIKNTFILLLASLIIRLLSLFNRIILTRYLGNEGISLYSLIMPSIMLFISFACFSLNITMSKVSALNNNITSLKKGIYISTISSSISSIILLLILNVLTKDLLKQPQTYYPILLSIPLLYLTSISSTIRGFLNGIEKVNITSIANLIEQIIRILFVILIFTLIKNMKISFYVSLSIIAMSIGEFFSIIFTSHNIKKLINTGKIEKSSNKTNKELTKEILKTSFPETSSSIVSNITFFFEPILFTFILTRNNISNEVILYKYSEVCAYVLPIITLFSFISTSISTSFLPSITKATNQSMKVYIEKIIFISLNYGLLTIFILYEYGINIINLLYNTSIGYELLKKYIWFFSIYYLLNPLTSILIAKNYSKNLFFLSTIVHIIKLLLLLILCTYTNDGLILSYLLSYYLLVIPIFIFLYRKYHFRLLKLEYLLVIIIIILCFSFNILIKSLNIHFIIKIILIIIVYLLLNIMIFSTNSNKK